MTKTFKVTIVRNGSICYIPLTFDPKPVFGTLRAPVKVTLNGYTFRSTIAAMGGPPCIPFRRSHREAAGLDKGSSEPRRKSAGSVTKEQVRDIAKLKMPDLAVNSLEAAERTVAGTARSIGLEVVD